MLPQPSRILYLHGFASSPSSRKARFLAQRFQEFGIRMETPDLAEGNFENLTITGQLRVIDELVGGQPVSLIGSSLGGYLAALYAATHPPVQRLVLLAPAFGFLDLWRARLGLEEMERWRHTDRLSLYHYGENREQNLRYQLMEDAGQYPLVPDFVQPALLFHGVSDDVVPVAASDEFTRTHPNARLVRLESDHELGNALAEIWQGASCFLLDAPVANSVLG